MSRSPRVPEPVSPFESGTWGTPERPCPSARTLASHLDGELAHGAARLVEAHLDACPACASDARRLEGLSHCLRSWARTGGATEAPPRLMSRVLRTVAPEGAALRRDASRSRRTTLLAVAAAALAWVGGGWLAVAERGAASGAASPPSSAGVPALVTEVAASRRPELGAAADPGEPSVSGELQAAWARLERIPGAAPMTAPSPDGDRWVAALLAGSSGEPFDPSGSARAVLGDGATSTGVEPTALQRAKARWLADRRRWLDDPRTADPTAAGVSVHEVFAATTVSRDASAVEPASRATGGLALQAIRAADRGEAAREATRGPAPYDLLAAVSAGQARLLPDAEGDDGTSIGVEVRPGARPILLLAGELFEGGVADRVLAASALLAPGPQTVRLRTRPLARPVGARGAATDRRPTAMGLVAGPELRALLARDDDDATLDALVRAQVVGAGLVGAEGSASPGLLALYRDDAAARSVRARALGAALGDDAVGFVATDPDGRFQGLERVDVADPVRADLLARLLDGYLAEGRTRSVGDAPRAGLRGHDVLAAISRRGPRLQRGRGLEPVTGLLFVGEAARSVLVPDYDR